MNKIIFIAVILTGCTTNPYAHLTEVVADNGISRFEDKRFDVNCYIYRDSDGSSISCVKVGQ
jgi:hypothetical protein